jgi:hypothetical protein
MVGRLMAVEGHPPSVVNITVVRESEIQDCRE